MSPIYLLLLIVCIAGVLFNLLLLVSCFKDTGKCSVIKTSGPVVIFQLFLHLVFLGTNAVEAVRSGEPPYQPECDVFSVLNVWAGIFSLFNFVALMLIEYEPSLFQKRDISPKKAAVFTALTAGFLSFIDSTLVFAACFTDASMAFYFASLINVLPTGVVLLIMWDMCTQAFATRKQHSTDTSQAFTTWDVSTRPKNIAFIVVMLLACLCGIATILVVISSPSFHQEFQQIERIRNIVFRFLESFATGIGIPLALTQLLSCHCSERRRPMDGQAII